MVVLDSVLRLAKAEQPFEAPKSAPTTGPPPSVDQSHHTCLIFRSSPSRGFTNEDISILVLANVAPSVANLSRKRMFHSLLLTFLP